MLEFVVFAFFVIMKLSRQFLSSFEICLLTIVATIPCLSTRDHKNAAVGKMSILRWFNMSTKLGREGGGNMIFQEKRRADKVFMTKTYLSSFAKVTERSKMQY